MIVLLYQVIASQNPFWTLILYLLICNLILLIADIILSIDYEYASMNFLPFDIGNHFCEYAGMLHVTSTTGYFKTCQWPPEFLWPLDGVLLVTLVKIITFWPSMNFLQPPTFAESGTYFCNPNILKPLCNQYLTIGIWCIIPLCNCYAFPCKVVVFQFVFDKSSPFKIFLLIQWQCISPVKDPSLIVANFSLQNKALAC